GQPDMSTPARIAVSGMGAISAIGKDVPSNYRSLRTSAHGIGPIRQLDTPHRGKLLVGEVAVTNEQLAERLGIQLDDAYTRSTLLAMLAAKEATANTNMADGCRTGLISATTVGRSEEHTSELQS